ncbi:hypothetical protein [Corynebacterium aquilae]|uniref:Lipoprotein n=1 Tax=Corynebacterium aquilae DSM 44791 TaxID=1431546 RepID=A0A1L7CEQ5_9CORY|nr:hypothetical protein [Corynebacterium aquilae]APT84326.1 hypothetical protein CAQU_03755 [Corynebacterium aquilae DSM 44791]
MSSSHLRRAVSLTAAAALLGLSACSSGGASVDNSFDDRLKDADLMTKQTFGIEDLYADSEHPVDFYVVGCPGTTRSMIEYQVDKPVEDYPEKGPKDDQQLLVIGNKDGWIDVKKVPTDTVDLCTDAAAASSYHQASEPMEFVFNAGKWEMHLPEDPFFSQELEQGADPAAPGQDQPAGEPQEQAPAPADGEATPAEQQPQQQ